MVPSTASRLLTEVRKTPLEELGMIGVEEGYKGFADYDNQYLEGNTILKQWWILIVEKYTNFNGDINVEEFDCLVTECESLENITEKKMVKLLS